MCSRPLLQWPEIRLLATGSCKLAAGCCKTTAGCCLLRAVGGLLLLIHRIVVPGLLMSWLRGWLEALHFQDLHRFEICILATTI